MKFSLPFQRCSQFQPVQKRFYSIDLFEFQTKKLFKANSVPIQRFEVVKNVEETISVLERFRNHHGIRKIGIKAQVKTGSRGKGIFKNGFEGGIHSVCNDDMEVLRIVKNMVGNRIMTPQTGIEGEMCDSVMLCEWFEIEQEKYLSFMIDKTIQCPVILFNGHGGASIESSKDTEKMYFAPGYQLNNYDLDTICKSMNFGKKHHEKAKECIRNLFNMFIAYRLNMLEVNPMSVAVETNEVVCFDAKASIDYIDYKKLPDTVLEIEDSTEGNEMNLGGNISCFANGAGLAMATMDCIQMSGGKVSVFYDIGGTSDREGIKKAIENAKKSDVILINMFGGIVDCYEVACMLTNYLPRSFKNVYVVLKGNNSNLAQMHLESRDIKVFGDLMSATHQAVHTAQKYVKDEKPHEIPSEV